MAKIPLDGSCEAEYADGYIHSETELNDISPYGPFERTNDDGQVEQYNTNVFNDILEKRPEAEHGSLVRFSLFHMNTRYDVDWSKVPANTRPIRFKHFERKSVGGVWVTDAMLVAVDFGYQYNDADGKNVEEVIRL